MRGKVFRTDADCGLPDKRGLRFTDRRSSDFPDTCHLDFPDASYLTKRPKSGTTELLSQMARGGLTALGTREGTEKGINFYALENRLFEELFKFLQACSNFRFPRGYYQKKRGISPLFSVFIVQYSVYSHKI